MAYKTEAERRGHALSEGVRRNIADYSRSCLRGLGAPSRPKALPLDLLHRLPRGFEPWCNGGPLNPRVMVMCGAWWLCREIELSSQRARLLEFELQALESDGRRIWKASMHLPASKTDLQAAGVSRSLVCSCRSPSSPSPSCVVHVLLDTCCSFVGDFRTAGRRRVPRGICRCFQTCMGRSAQSTSWWKPFAPGQRSSV